VIVAARLRKGFGQLRTRARQRLVADALKTSRSCGATGLLVVAGRLGVLRAATWSPRSGRARRRAFFDHRPTRRRGAPGDRRDR